MLDSVRTSLHRVITTKAGDSFAPVRVPKDLARRANALFGFPLCSKEELVKRRAAESKLAALRSGSASTESKEKLSAGQAPVMVYFQKDRNARMLERIAELLDAKAIAFTRLDVTGDETTLDYVLREARCKDDELPVVFVAGKPVGGYAQLVDWDVSGRLATALRGG